jgi:DNA processing protein
LFQDVRANGCLLSQFAIGTTSSRDYRPLLRNQTVAALSSAVLVVEAPERSGALSTASGANELGRQVFVVPANVDNLNFRGSHALIRDGATLVDHPDQVLDAMGIKPVANTGPAPEFSDVQQKIMSVLTVTPLASEFIVERTGLETADVMAEITVLELEGHVIRDVGGYAIRP